MQKNKAIWKIFRSPRVFVAIVTVRSLGTTVEIEEADAKGLIGNAPQVVRSCGVA